MKHLCLRLSKICFLKAPRVFFPQARQRTGIILLIEKIQFKDKALGQNNIKPAILMLNAHLKINRWIVQFSIILSSPGTTT